MSRRERQYFPQRINLRVRSMTGMGLTCGGGDDVIAASIGAPNALSAALILSGQSIAAALTQTTFASGFTGGTEAQMARYGRNVTMIASGAATSTVAIRGRDYLGQPMSETYTLNGATTVQGIKAFRYIDAVVVLTTTGATTINVGVGNVLGVPFKFKQLDLEMKNNVVAANGGTFVAGLANATAATATNADPRGTYLPVTVIPDGTNTFEIRYVADIENLHGNAHFFA